MDRYKIEHIFCAMCLVDHKWENPPQFCIPFYPFGYTILEVITMEQRQQNYTKEFEEQAKKVETFNPHWNKGEFLGPNTLRQEKKTNKYGEEES